MSKKYQNADTTIAWDLWASGSSIVAKSGEWALFPSDWFPYEVTLEHYEWSVVTKREILTISARASDAFTISARAVQDCVQDESAATKTRTSNALSFVSGDRMYMTINEEEFNALETFKNTTVPNTYATKSDIQKWSVVYWASSTWNDDYAITLDPVPSSLSDLKGSIYFLADVWNTWSATLNINALWAKTIKKANDVDLEDWDIEANQKVEIVYNSIDDVFEMVSQSAILPWVDINWQTEKTVLVDDDEFLIWDSEDSFNLKKVKKSNMPSWAMKLLSRYDITTAVSQIDFNSSVFTWDYDWFLVRFYMKFSATNATMRMKFSDDNLSSTENMSYNLFSIYNHAWTNAWSWASNQSSVPLTWYSSNNLTNYEWMLVEMDLPPTDVPFRAMWRSVLYSSSNQVQTHWCCIKWTWANNWNALRFNPNTWNVDDWYICVYWYKKS